MEVRSLSGKLVLNIPPPPSDRIFIGFRPVPKLLLSAQPIVGERNISMLRVIHWIEKKLLLEFQVRQIDSVFLNFNLQQSSSKIIYDKNNILFCRK